MKHSSASLIFIMTLTFAPWAHGQTNVGDERGQRGGFTTLILGPVIGQTTDMEGESLGGSLGLFNMVRFGEEAIPNLTLGLALGGFSFEGNNGQHKGAAGGILMDFSWRPAPKSMENLVLYLATGLGGGQVKRTSDDSVRGAPAGAIYMAGVGYEILFAGGEKSAKDKTLSQTRSWVIAPTVRAIVIPPSGSNEAMYHAFIVSLDVTTYSGLDISVRKSRD